MIPFRFTPVGSSPQPYEAKDVIPIGKVDVTSTPYSVKSLGLSLSRYVITDENAPDFTSLTNLTLVDTGVTPIVGFYHGGGAPPGFSSITKFAYKYTGWFYARTSGVISFSTIGIGQLRFYISTVDEYLYGGASSYTELDPLVYKESGYAGVSSGTFYAIGLY